MISPRHPSYSDFLDSPPFYRKLLGMRGLIDLTDDFEVGRYIDHAAPFQRIFGAKGMTFRNARHVQTIYPYSAQLATRLGQVLAFSFVTQLNLHCGHDPKFLHGLMQWDGALGRLEVLRIKYNVSVKEVSHLFNYIVRQIDYHCRMRAKTCHGKTRSGQNC